MKIKCKDCGKSKKPCAFRIDGITPAGEKRRATVCRSCMNAKARDKRKASASDLHMTREERVFLLGVAA